MAYIDWWNRTGPVTLGERFGLNEISIARNTLSPTKSYTEDRIDMKPGGIVEPGVEYYGVKKGTTVDLTPGKENLELAEKVYSKQFGNKKGLELWKAIGRTKRSGVKARSVTGETGGWKLNIPEGKVSQKQLIEILGEDYNQKMKRGSLSQKTYSWKRARPKNYVANKVAELLNRTEVQTKGTKVSYLFDKPTPDQLDFIRNYIDSPHLMDRTVNNMRILDKEFGKMLSEAVDSKVGKEFFRKTLTLEMAKDALTKAGVKNITDSQAARAMTRLGQSYQGKLFKNLIGITENKQVGEFIINSFNELEQYHPWRQATYNAALDDLKTVMGNKAGNLSGFKQTFKELMQKRYENRKFVFNEVFSISTSANRGSYPYAYFVDLTETAMNKGVLGTFQGKASMAEGKIIDAIKKYRKTKDIKHYNEAVRVKNVFNNDTRRLFLSSEKVLKYEKEFGIKPNALKLELGTAKQVKDKINFASDHYTTTNLKKWKDLGIDIDTHTGRSGYVKTFGEKYRVPKNVTVASELFTKETRFGKGKKIFDVKALENFIKNNKTLTEAIKVAKTTKGPPRARAVQAILYILGSGIGLKLLDEYGISSATAGETDKQIIETDDKTQEAGAIFPYDIVKTIIDEPVKAATIGGATAIGVAPKKVWEAVKWAGRKLIPFMTPAVSHAFKLWEGKPYDPTSGHDVTSMAFWNSAIKAMGKTSRWKNKKIGVIKRLKDIAWRGGIPTRFLPLISGGASVAMGPVLIKDAAAWLQDRLEKKDLTGKGGIADYAGIISDEAGGSLFIEDVVKEKQKQAAEGMDYATGGIASLMK